MLSFFRSATGRVMRREFRRIGDHKVTGILIIVCPLIVFIVLAGIYHGRVVVDIPIGICDLDNSELSRTIIRSFESTRSLKIAGYAQSVDGIQDDMRRGAIQGGVVIPANLETDIKSNKQGTVVVYKNTANLIIGNLILKDASSITQTISAGILLKRLEARGLAAEQAMSLANPIRIDSYSLFNPGYNYANFLIPGLVMVILQMLIMVVGVLVINGEINEGTLKDLFDTADGKVTAVLFGKTLAHLTLHSATGLGVLGLLFPLFGIPLRGSTMVAMALMVYFIAACFLVSLVVSCIVRDKFIATDFAALFNSPAFLFSGYTFPLWAMPGLHRTYAQLLPFTHFLSGFLKIYQLGAPARYLLPELTALSIFVGGSLVAALFLLKYRVKPLLAATAEIKEPV